MTYIFRHRTDKRPLLWVPSLARTLAFGAVHDGEFQTDDPAEAAALLTLGNYDISPDEGNPPLPEPDEGTGLVLFPTDEEIWRSINSGAATAGTASTTSPTPTPPKRSRRAKNAADLASDATPPR